MFIFNEFVNQWQLWGKLEILTSLHINVTCFVTYGLMRSVTNATCGEAE
jgi:hypothetical protein